MSTLLDDLRRAARSLRASPGFAGLAVGTVALGIGTATAAFTLVDRVLLRSIPFRDARRLVQIEQMRNGSDAPTPIPAAYPVARWWVANTRTLTDATVFTQPDQPVLTGRGLPTRVRAPFVDGRFFSVLGVSPAIGRTILPSDDSIAAARVAVVSHRFWRTRMNRDDEPVGQVITLNGVRHEIVGVMGPSFEFPARAEIWTPLQTGMTPAQRTRVANSHFARIIGHLAPGAQASDAMREFDALSAAFAEEIPEYGAWRTRVTPLHEWVTGGARAPILVLGGAALLVLAIACANAASLFLVRGLARRRDHAMEIALGASAGRVTRRILAEALLVSLAGTAIGVPIGAVFIRAFVSIARSDIPRASEIAIDPRIVLVVAAAAGVMALLMALIPARRVLRDDPMVALRGSGGDGQGRRTGAMMRAAVTGQLALSVIVLAGAGILGASLFRLLDTPLGFEPENVVTAHIRLPGHRYPTDGHRKSFVESLLAESRGLPGVTHAAVASGRPFRVGSYGPGDVPGSTAPRRMVAYVTVTPDYFATLRIPQHRGDALDPERRPEAIVVNEAFARHWFPKGDAIGAQATYAGSAERYEIVGVVGDTYDWALDREPWPHVYLPYTTSVEPMLNLLIRTTSSPDALGERIRRLVGTLDPELSVDDFGLLDAIIRGTAARPRLYASLMIVFALLATVLATLGAYGVSLYTVTRQTREIGLRVALGSTPWRVARRVAARGIGAAAIGVGVGVGVAMLATRVLRGQVHEIEPNDPLVLMGAGMLSLTIASIATVLAARRAARVDPMVSLRAE